MMKKKILLLSIVISVVTLWSGLSIGVAHAADKIDCAALPQEICDAVNKETKDTKTEDSGLFKLLVTVLKFMTALVGVAAIGAIVYAGILYTSAGGGSDRVAKSKTIITNTVIGLIAYGLMFIALNWLIPGGVLG